MAKTSKLTKARILALIGEGDKTNGAIVEKAVYTIWLGQTADERQAADVKYDNRKGFSTTTRFWGTRIGRILQGEVDRKGGDLSKVEWGQVVRATTWQAEAVKVAKYHAAQVAKVWNRMNAEKARKAA